MICQDVNSKAGFWMCIYSEGYADVSLTDEGGVFDSWNMLFAYQSNVTNAYHWIDSNSDWGYGSMPQAATDINLSASQVESNVDQGTEEMWTNYENTPFDIVELVAWKEAEAAKVHACMDENAENYEPTATDDDGSCIIIGCTDSNSDNYDEAANEDNGNCSRGGCTDESAFNYDSLATYNNNTCDFTVVKGCMDTESRNYNPKVNTSDDSCQPQILKDPMVWGGAAVLVVGLFLILRKK